MPGRIEGDPRASRLNWTIAALVAAMLAATSASAEERLAGNVMTMDPRVLALGGALRASPSSTGSVYLNPATMSMERLYHIELMYQYMTEDDMHMAGAAIVDSITSVVGAGLSLNYTAIDRKKIDFEAWDVRLALSGAIADMFYLGLTGKYLRLEHNLESDNRGPNGVPAMPHSGSQQVDGITLDVGAAFRVGKVFSLGVVGYNLTNVKSIYAPIELGTGAALFLIDMITIEADFVIDFTSFEDTTYEIDGGLEIFVANRVPLRVGYVYDFYYDIHTIAAGAGYVDAAFAIDLGFRREIIENGRMYFALGVKIFVN